MSSSPYLLKLPHFSLEFRVLWEESRLFSQRFKGDDPGYVFAVVEVWLIQADASVLIASAENPGNFLEDVKALVHAVRKPPSVSGDALAGQGTWAPWMDAYWRKVDEERVSAQDDALYEKLIGLSVLDGDQGHVVVYEYDGEATIEVAPRGGGHVWCAYCVSELADELDALIGCMQSALLNAM